MDNKKIEPLMCKLNFFENKLLKEVNKEKRKEIKENILFFKKRINEVNKEKIKWTGVFNK